MSLNTSEPYKYLVTLLKSKGTGPTMGKSLTQDQLNSLPVLLNNEEFPPVTRATLLTALLTLEPTEIEKKFIQTLQQNPNLLPAPLTVLLPEVHTPQTPFESLVHKVILRQDLTAEEAQQAMEALFDPHIPTLLKAAWLEGERLKRETLVENTAFYNVLWKKCQRITTKLPFVIDLSNGYDGFNRNLYLTPFTAMALAKKGIPCVLHGMDEVSPKKGINPHKILMEMGLNPYKSLEEAKNDLEDPAIGWTYVDQSIFFPELFALKQLRIEMVKRPFIATLEKLLCPILGQKTGIVTGYTHPPYKHTLTDLLSQNDAVDASLILRGTEGSMQLDLDRKTPWIFVKDTQVTSDYVRPSDFGINEQEQEPDSTITIKDCIREGLDALNGKPGLAKSIIDYQTAVIMRFFKHV
jgi:anthranilate phosphoribosyltransferase